MRGAKTISDNDARRTTIRKTTTPITHILMLINPSYLWLGYNKVNIPVNI